MFYPQTSRPATVPATSQLQTHSTCDAYFAELICPNTRVNQLAAEDDVLQGVSQHDAQHSPWVAADGQQNTLAAAYTCSGIHLLQHTLAAAYTCSGTHLPRLKCTAPGLCQPLNCPQASFRASKIMSAMATCSSLPLRCLTLSGCTSKLAFIQALRTCSTAHHRREYYNSQPGSQKYRRLQSTYSMAEHVWHTAVPHSMQHFDANT